MSTRVYSKKKQYNMSIFVFSFINLPPGKPSFPGGPGGPRIKSNEKSKQIEIIKIKLT
jgi:hypothetical protein